MMELETVRRLLMDAAGEALCDSCLAFACSVSPTEMREATEQLLSSVIFKRVDNCASCRHTVPSIKYMSMKCAHCSDVVHAGDDALAIGGDIFHAACFRVLSTKESIRISRKLSAESRRLIEESRRRIRDDRSSPPSSSG